MRHGRWGIFPPVRWLLLLALPRRVGVRQLRRVVSSFIVIFVFSGLVFLTGEHFGRGTSINLTPNFHHASARPDINSIVVKNHAPVKNISSLQTVPGLVRQTQPPQTNSKCAEIKDIPKLVNNRDLNLTSEVQLSQLEQMVFQSQPDQIREIVSRASRLLRERHQNASRINGSSVENATITECLAPLEVRRGDYLYLPGGHWRPATCLPRWKVAIIVPFRNRTFQLSVFLRYMIPFLQKQLLEFAIYVVNQANELPFNRGMLLNVGFLESLNFSHWDCFVFHDVDHIPQSELNPYGCVNFPRHFISGADNRNYKVPYSTSFGGVNGFTAAQFRKINGFANVYWGWCCEDDDLEQRVRVAKIKKTRYKGSVGYYKAIIVHHDKMESVDLNNNNRQLLKKARTRFKTDGLNNLRYKTPTLELHTLYTNISVDIQRI